jgi:N-acetylated-alpha-linked acidic dipeptidase
LWGTMALRLADASALPFDYTDYANQIGEYFNESVKLAKRRHLETAVDEKAMNDALKDFADEAARLERERQRLAGENDKSASARLRRLNDALIGAERAFIDERGLRGRPWYRHEIYAPGIFTGYAAQPLTDFRQALDDRNTTNLREGLDAVVAAIKRATEVLKKGRE